MTNDLDLKPHERRIKHAVNKLTTEIEQLEKRIEKLENELLQNKTMTVDIIGQDF